MKAMNDYVPEPIDTSTVNVPEDLAALAEQLAKNTHEVWALGRMSQGWVYGPERNDADKTHPCLVPYEDLPESEKEYDRHTSLEALKVILSLGYKLSKL